MTAPSSVVGAGASAVCAYYDYKGAKKGEPVIVNPPIEGNSKELQHVAAAKMKMIPGPCPRDKFDVTHRSALKCLVIDYADLRQNMRPVKDE